MEKIITKWWGLITIGLLIGIYSFGYIEMYFHQDDLDWFLLAQKPFWQMMSSPIGDHVNYVFRLLLKVEWELFHLYFPAYLGVSLLLHAGVIWLIYRLSKEVSRRDDLAIGAALLFVVNTNWTEVVLWISGQTISITALFVLLAMLAVWQKRGAAIALLLASWTSALALGLLGSVVMVDKKMRWTALSILVLIALLYLWKGSDSTKIIFGLDWLMKVILVWGLAIINTVIGRTLIPFDKFELIRIVGVSGMLIAGLWKWRAKLLAIWRDEFSRLVLLQIAAYYLVVAMGRAQYGIGIMRAERYAYLGLALLLLFLVRVLRKVVIPSWGWICLGVIITAQCLGLYVRAKAYVVRPQQMKILVEQVTKVQPSEVKMDEYLPHFVLNDERLRYRDLMLLIND